MTDQPIATFAALGRSIHRTNVTARSGAHHDFASDAYRELWAGRRLVDAVRLTLADALWESEHDDEHASVPKHHLVLLEAALDVATGQRAATTDGFPHGGCEVGASGVCNAGFCPCHDGRRIGQPPLLDRAA
ncbi:MAG: hypothetical protein GEU80_17800 [Dehalococcoidia bacterium]|nr:hypothetical protein [Dehalococcoidia bacterium]